MSEDYCCAGKRKSKNDKRAKARYNKYKRGGAMRTMKINAGADRESQEKS